MTVLLKDALQPNLVQTLENNPAFIHGGPFANIAHGCNSVIATKTALKLADYVVTEAGFGADLGAEKFIDIKCRKSGLRPERRGAGRDDPRAQVPRRRRAEGAHARRTCQRSRRASPTSSGTSTTCATTTACRAWSRSTTSRRTPTPRSTLLAEEDRAPRRAGGRRARTGPTAARARRTLAQHGRRRDRARAEQTSSFVYDDADTLWDKMTKVATKIYGASDVTADSKVRAQIKKLQDDGYGHYPVCVAKTQYSFSTDPLLRGAPSGHVVNIREVRLAAGAEFVVMVCGDVMTMPGLPKSPHASRIDIDAKGKVVGAVLTRSVLPRSGAKAELRLSHVPTGLLLAPPRASGSGAWRSFAHEERHQPRRTRRCPRAPRCRCPTQAEIARARGRGRGSRPRAAAGCPCRGRFRR